MARRPPPRSPSWWQKYLPKPAIPPVIGSLGAAVMKMIGIAGDVDFVFSLRDIEVGSFFQSALNWGWLVFLAVCILWYSVAVLAKYKPRSSTVFVQSALVTALVFFELGSVVTASLGKPEQTLIGGYGRTLGLSEPNCRAVVYTERLVSYRDTHDVILICGPNDPTTDVSVDDRVSISRRFMITGKSFQINSLLTAEQDAFFRKYRYTWLRVGIVPKTTTSVPIDSIQDIRSVGGLVFDDVRTVGR